MPASTVTDEGFIALWRQYGSVAKIAAQTGLSLRGINDRRRSLERRLGVELNVASKSDDLVATVVTQRNELSLKNGSAVVFSDAHYWPGEPTAAHKALVRLVKTLKPKIIIANGDLFDGSSVSRHPKAGWEKLPSVVEELDTVKIRLAEVRRAHSGARLFRTRGNHDARFEYNLSTHAPEFRGVHGFHLEDHLPAWEESWSVAINGNVIVKHRWHNGVHAVYNNVMKSGQSIVTGHLHSLKVTPWTDYNGTRYGVDTGTLADPNGPQFEYLEDNPRNWRSGFVVLSFHDGKLLPPETCEVLGGVAYFRGAVV